ncbi:MAG: hypothetical protein ACKVOJ_13530 [Sphingomonadaceae bacterium]
MTISHPTIKIALLSALLVTVGACAKETASAAKTSATTGTKAAQNRTVKEGAALDFSFRMQTPVRANAPHSVTIDIEHGYAGQSLSLAANADGAVQLGTTATTISLTKGRAASWTIPFTATADGTYYINVIGQVVGPDGVMLGRAYAVRVEVGNQIAKPKLTPKEVVLPAQEKIN